MKKMHLSRILFRSELYKVYILFLYRTIISPSSNVQWVGISKLFRLFDNVLMLRLKTFRSMYIGLDCHFVWCEGCAKHDLNHMAWSLWEDETLPFSMFWECSAVQIQNPIETKFYCQFSLHYLIYSIIQSRMKKDCTNLPDYKSMYGFVNQRINYHKNLQ